MISYKKQLFVSLIGEITLNEVYGTSNNSLLEMLLEAPMDDSTANKIITNKKRVSIYYQGDDKTKKSWYQIDPVRLDKKNGGQYLLAYIVPKDGSKPILTYFIQDKIVNWNVLGNKKAEKADDYDSKILKFFVDPKVPDAQKSKFKEKLRQVGAKVGKVVLGVAFLASSLGGLKLHSFIDNNVHAQAYKEFLSLRKSTFTEKDMKDSDIKALKQMVEYAINHPKKFIHKNGQVDFYEVANDINKGEEQIKFGDKKSFGLDQKNIGNPYTKIAFLIGNANLKVSDTGYVVRDQYDFNQFYEHPEDYKLVSLPKETGKIVQSIGNGNYLRGFEEIGNYYESLGYKGFPIQINIPKG